MLSQVEELSEAMGALAFIQGDSKKKADDIADAYNVLASYTGVSADMLRGDLSPALWALSGDMELAAFSTEQLLYELMAIPGVHFDASNWQAELARLAASSDETVAHLAQLISTMLQASGASLYLDGNTVKVKWGSKGSYTPPSARKSSGGGGSGKDMDKTISAIEKLIELMRQTVALQDHSRELMQLAQDYHEVRGEVQGVIAYMQKEQQVIAESTATMQGYVAQLEAEMAVKKQQIAGMSTDAKEYEQLAKELDELQSLHQDYSKQLIRNRTDSERLTKAIKEQQDAIRQMEIDLRNLIHDAILDREARTRRMLQGTIDLENEIIDIITERYEKERDELIRLADLKRKALQEEMRLLDEQLAKRKALEDQEDKLKKLQQLEEQLARISMDPTRRKEELALREEIAKLRKEIAWGMAEDEVDAQKDALQQQLDSVEEYLAYIEEYYTELLSNPRKLIEEMSELLRKTDEEILAWLMANHTEYETATDTTRQNMVIGWQEMLDDMRGYTRVYWDEVEAIIAQGDDAIIAFLMEHSEDYRTAGKLQAEAYVDQWRQQLENLRNAYKQVAAEIQSYNYVTIQPSTGSGSSSSGSGGGSSSAKTQYKFVAAGKTYGPYSTVAEAQMAKELEVAKIKANATSGSSMYAQAIAAIMQAEIVRYAKGGLNTQTGLAWLDGTPQKPERILSPYQTELFEDLIASLHDIRVRTPVIPAIPTQQAGAAQPFTIEQIVVNVEKLETDEDYEAMAEKVGQFIFDGMRRGTPVGGFR